MEPRLWLALLLVGFAGGLATDPTPARPPVRRAGYRVLEGDFHAHTTLSDGSLTPFGLVRQAERRGLDVLGVTEHNTVLAARLARWYSGLGTNGPVIVLGEEITTARFHIIALGLSETVTPHHEAKAVIDDIHAQGGFAVAAHPVTQFWPALVPVRPLLDGAEVMHPSVYGGRTGAWAWPSALAFYEEAEKPLVPIGSSDYHWGSVLGLCRTLLFVDDDPAPDAKHVLAALAERRVVVVDQHGKMYGPPKLVEALAREPYVPRAQDYGYHGTGNLDRITRTLGFFGLVGLVLFGRKRGSLPDA